MKRKLIKTGNDYILRDTNGEVLAITNGVTEGKKLSKQNSDEIFGIVDVEKLAEECSDELADVFDYNDGYGNISRYKNSDVIEKAYINGFNKALELNKYKVFTVEDVILIAEYVRVASQSTPNTRTKDLFNEYQSLQQPNEIEVEIEMEAMNLDEIREQGKGFLNANTNKPKLDENNCLILKKI